ncbi:MAG: MucR family transcriptional regulator [Alphaproteobacteria bacterium]|nr:MucR family transcriptional regulator [Alphaproteobacteria bacterium]
MSENSDNAASRGEILRMTTDVVAAYVGHNMLPPGQVGDVISTVFGSLKNLDDHGGQIKPPTPAVPVRRSVTRDHIVCLEDGKKLKMLKRHLRSTYDMTPEEYRAKWKLPIDYPMVAPAYAQQRSEFAKKIGLGRKTKVAPSKRK